MLRAIKALELPSQKVLLDVVVLLVRLYPKYREPPSMHECLAASGLIETMQLHPRDRVHVY